jgi:hypothetical protein
MVTRDDETSYYVLKMYAEKLEERIFDEYRPELIDFFTKILEMTKERRDVFARRLWPKLDKMDDDVQD